MILKFTFKICIAKHNEASLPTPSASSETANAALQMGTV